MRPIVLIFFGFLMSLSNLTLAKDTVDTLGLEQHYLFSLGQEFANASKTQNKETAHLIFDKAMETIFQVKTPIEKFEHWMHQRQKFSSMLAEAFTVAVAITAADIFLHPEAGGIQTADALNTVGSSVGVIVGSYMPYHWVSAYLKKKQSRKMLNAFFAGINSVTPLPNRTQDLAQWLLSTVGPTQATKSCLALLN